jgi:hypothetical protein
MKKIKLVGHVPEGHADKLREAMAMPVREYVPHIYNERHRPL